MPSGKGWGGFFVMKLPCPSGDDERSQSGSPVMKESRQSEQDSIGVILTADYRVSHPDKSLKEENAAYK